jgi:hypothetical protein
MHWARSGAELAVLRLSGDTIIDRLRCRQALAKDIASL